MDCQGRGAHATHVQFRSDRDVGADAARRLRGHAVLNGLKYAGRIESEVEQWVSSDDGRVGYEGE